MLRYRRDADLPIVSADRTIEATLFLTSTDFVTENPQNYFAAEKYY